MESSGLRPPSAIVVAAVVSDPVLALMSLAGAAATRYQCDRHGGIVGVDTGAINWLTHADIKATLSSQQVTENCGLYAIYDKLFDAIWFSQIPVVIANIVLYVNGYQNFALVLGIHRTLLQRLHWIRLWTVERKGVWVCFATAGSTLTLLGLLGSALLTWYGMGLKVLPLCIVSVTHVWSSIEGVIYLWPWERTWPQEKMWCWEQRWFPQTTGEDTVFVRCILACSVLSQSSWAALREEDNDSFLAIVYFTYVLEELLWSGHMLWKCWGRSTRRSGGHSDEEDPNPLRQITSPGWISLTRTQ